MFAKVFNSITKDIEDSIKSMSSFQEIFFKQSDLRKTYTSFGLKTGDILWNGQKIEITFPIPKGLKVSEEYLYSRGNKIWWDYRESDRVTVLSGSKPLL